MTAATVRTVWMAHREYEDCDCSGEFVAVGPPDGGVRLFVCDGCELEMGVPLRMLGDDAGTAWLMERSGIPARHAGTDLDLTDDNLDARMALKSWAEAFGKGQLSVPPILVGEVGRGKTQLLVSTAIAVMSDTQRLVRYWSMADLLKAEQQTFKTGDPSPVEAAKQTRVLILDDIGAERESAFALDMLGQIIDARYRDGLPTLGATNVMPSEWAEVFGDRTASRLLEATVAVKVGGPDRRAL